MSELYDLDPLSPAEERLHADAAFGGLNYPGDLSSRDQYFREGFALIRTATNPKRFARSSPAICILQKMSLCVPSCNSFLQDLELGEKR
jgi:hypothetical protein